MKYLLKDIYDYQHHLNLSMLELFRKDKRKLSQTVVFLFSHCLNAHQNWLADILKEQALDFDSVHPITAFQALEMENHHKSLNIIDHSDLRTAIRHQDREGRIFSNTIGEILFHIANHHTHHRAQMITEIRRLGIEPMISDYIYYRRKPVQ